MYLLIVEDDEDLIAAEKTILEKNGHTADTAATGADGLAMALGGGYDCILLDRMLPELDGLTVLRELRSSGVASPVILITAMNGIGDRVDGLDSGADDYLVKPFAMEELLARIRALARRPPQWEQNEALRFGDVELDVSASYLKGPASGCVLSKREAQLLSCFLRNANQVLPRELLLSRVWGGYAPVEDGNLDNYIHLIRKRLKKSGSRTQITTIRGVGYRMEETPC